TTDNPDPGGAIIRGLQDLNFQLPENVALEVQNGTTMYYMTGSSVVTNVNFTGIINGTITLTENWAGGGLILNGGTVYSQPTAPTVLVTTISVAPPALQGILTIHYINAQTGKALQASTTVVSAIGSWQVLHIPDITHYTSVDTGNEVAFQQTLASQTRTMTYNPEVETVKIDFEDSNGKTIKASATLTGYYGSSLSYHPPGITGYQTAKNVKITYNTLYQNSVIKY
ncbi:MucBP domain-containing protein, partial [Lactococcus nasutitermitis]